MLGLFAGVFSQEAQDNPDIEPDVRVIPKPSGFHSWPDYKLAPIEAASTRSPRPFRKAGQKPLYHCSRSLALGTSAAQRLRAYERDFTSGTRQECSQICSSRRFGSGGLPVSRMLLFLQDRFFRTGHKIGHNQNRSNWKSALSARK